MLGCETSLKLIIKIEWKFAQFWKQNMFNLVKQNSSLPCQHKVHWWIKTRLWIVHCHYYFYFHFLISKLPLSKTCCNSLKGYPQNGKIYTCVIVANWCLWFAIMTTPTHHHGNFAKHPFARNLNQSLKDGCKIDCLIDHQDSFFCHSKFLILRWNRSRFEAEQTMALSRSSSAARILASKFPTSLS